MGALMRAHDWAATPLGPVACWPQCLRTAVDTALGCAFPMIVLWDPTWCRSRTTATGR
jgi:hypothetical protein